MATNHYSVFRSGENVLSVAHKTAAYINKRFSFEFISHLPHSRTTNGTGDDPMRSGRFGVVLLWATVTPADGYGDGDGERAVLAWVIHEIKALAPLIAGEPRRKPTRMPASDSITPGSNRIWGTSSSASGSTSRRPAPNRDRFRRSYKPRAPGTGFALSRPTFKDIFWLFDKWN
jgi:hypothetical protein